MLIQIGQPNADPTAGRDPDILVDFLSVNFISFFPSPAFCLDVTENGFFGRVDKKEDPNNILLIQIYYESRAQIPLALGTKNQGKKLVGKYIISRRGFVNIHCMIFC